MTKRNAMIEKTTAQGISNPIVVCTIFFVLRIEILIVGQDLC
jgi:hypothetical protein